MGQRAPTPPLIWGKDLAHTADLDRVTARDLGPIRTIPANSQDHAPTANSQASNPTGNNLART